MNEDGRILEARPADGVAWLTISRPGKRNALVPPMRAALTQAVAEAHADPSVRVLVLSGDGGHFCAGGDVSGLARMPKAELPDFLRAGHALVRALVLGDKPVLAAIAGTAAGGGAGIALACDHLIAAEDASLVLPFHKLGLVADYGLAWTMSRRLGPGRTQALLMAPRRLPAGEALALGLVDAVCAAEALATHALELAIRMAGESPLAMRWTKRLMRAQLPPLEPALQLELQAQAECFSSPAFDAGAAAFLAKGRAG